MGFRHCPGSKAQPRSLPSSIGQEGQGARGEQECFLGEGFLGSPHTKAFVQRVRSLQCL
jgi:hypothetical protein